MSEKKKPYIKWGKTLLLLSRLFLFFFLIKLINKLVNIENIAQDTVMLSLLC